MQSDSSTRLVAIIFSLFFCALGFSGAWSSPSTAPVHAAGPIIVMSTPRIVVPTVQPTQAPTAAPLPTPEPIVVVQYVEVPVYLPATVDSPPPPIVHEQAINVPPGAVQVTVSDNGAPVVSSIHMSGLDGADRPARLGGETAKQVTP